MPDIYLNPQTNDIEFNNGVSRLTANNGEQARQGVSYILRLFRGEWFKDTTLGIPYIRNENNPLKLLGKSNKDLFDAYIKEGILSVSSVNSIDEYRSEWNREERRIRITARVSAIDGSSITLDTTI